MPTKNRILDSGVGTVWVPLGISNLADQDHIGGSGYRLQRRTEESHAAYKSEDGAGVRTALCSVPEREISAASN